jgi:hypothetical protein
MIQIIDDIDCATIKNKFEEIKKMYPKPKPNEKEKIYDEEEKFDENYETSDEENNNEDKKIHITRSKKKKLYTNNGIKKSAHRIFKEIAENVRKDLEDNK